MTIIYQVDGDSLLAKNIKTLVQKYIRKEQEGVKHLLLDISNDQVNELNQLIQYERYCQGLITNTDQHIDLGEDSVGYIGDTIVCLHNDRTNKSIKGEWVKMGSD